MVTTPNELAHVAMIVSPTYAVIGFRDTGILCSRNILFKLTSATNSSRQKFYSCSLGTRQIPASLQTRSCILVAVCIDIWIFPEVDGRFNYATYSWSFKPNHLQESITF